MFLLPNGRQDLPTHLRGVREQQKRGQSHYGEDTGCAGSRGVIGDAPLNGPATVEPVDKSI